LFSIATFSDKRGLRINKKKRKAGKINIEYCLPAQIYLSSIKKRFDHPHSKIRE
jgi:hypothetical protein